MDTNANYLPAREQRIAREQLDLTRHAKTRCKQRGIPELLAKIAIEAGERENDGRGGVRWFISKRAVRNIIQLLGHTPQIEALAGKYIVSDLSGFRVVTVAHRNS